MPPIPDPKQDPAWGTSTFTGDQNCAQWHKSGFSSGNANCAQVLYTR